ncbi:Holo-[acyl-carrier-protein] synthase [Candidatus Erwinia haradaeae]|uniref:Holo-[acyl-carrier-protein] synthase n=1 Tax=Candidatus Erwinia haradaeae TaxID=1922217 RepID=A0A451DKB1_9GAMM|nr:holo-ACP synthase [Candidatus Erwinia haradaeae]VFP87160.1 Holo-[acyl-carrier-protein] synthase [Candidatus Erwinia haradaeae]
MSVCGVGIDIVEIIRIASTIRKVGDRFAERILSDAEFSQYKKNLKPELFLAKRFAVKEATVKAFGIGMRGGLAFNQVETCHDSLGRPYLCLLKHAKIIAQTLCVTRIHVTFSDERQYACAMVILED